MTTSLSSTIRDKAFELGFLDCGFSSVRRLEDHELRYMQWLRDGNHASMDYMARNIDKRLNPALLVEGAKTVISLLYNYYNPEKLEGSPLVISKYAYSHDYHDVIKDKLKILDHFIRELDPAITQRYFVDSAPVLERAWAQNSGLGWVGKNSCLISRKHGSFFFIAEIITTLQLETDTAGVKDYCGSCQKCIDSCPTRAIQANRTINSNRCISFQTIENKGDISLTLKGRFANNIFGCDICQDVCPWNRKAHHHAEPLFNLRPELKDMTLDDWQTLDEDTYKRIFKGSPIKRAKFSGLKRNISFVNDAFRN